MEMPTTKVEYRVVLSLLLMVLLTLLVFAVINTAKSCNSSSSAVSDSAKCDSQLSQCRQELDECNGQVATPIKAMQASKPKSDSSCDLGECAHEPENESEW